jgi:Chlorophyll A-B binding protein
MCAAHPWSVCVCHVRCRLMASFATAQARALVPSSCVGASCARLVFHQTIFLRNAGRETDPEKRIYPGGYFDPLGLASEPKRAFKLKTAEIKHGRLAMLAFLGALPCADCLSACVSRAYRCSAFSFAGPWHHSARPPFWPA